LTLTEPTLAAHHFSEGSAVSRHEPLDRFNFDCRIEYMVIHPLAAGPDDEYMDTNAVAKWWGVSSQWFVTGRAQGYGPPFIMITPTKPVYKRGVLRRWLKDRQRMLADA
jgi:hypothetical protein